MLKSDIEWPQARWYSSETEDEPITFFSEGLCNSSSFDLMLGFFSSSAISLLSTAFALFLGREGKMRLIVNTFLTDSDRECLKGSDSTYYSEKEFDLYNLEKMAKILSKRDRHFFECLSWLIAQGRIEIRVVSPKNRNGISHSKAGIFSDGENSVAFTGSCNFSRTALLENMEQLSVFCDWDGIPSQHRINKIRQEFEDVFAGNSPRFNTVELEDLTDRIKEIFPPKEFIDLLQEEKQLSREVKGIPEGVKNHMQKSYELLEKVCTEPRFPFSGKPREYQTEAFKQWVANGQKGLFAMATGTGKTITALNILLEIYKGKNNTRGVYQALVLVPTVQLAAQWEEECRRFNFTRIVQVGSAGWMDKIAEVKRNNRLGLSGPAASFVIISTYRSYSEEKYFSLINDLGGDSKERLLVIADEAHNLGADKMLEHLSAINKKDIPYFARRLGLSATPERQYQDSTNKEIFKFFNLSEDKYTYEYSMKKAIENDVLCHYIYHPVIVYLTEDEMVQYREISKKIAKIWACGDEDGENESLLLLRLQRKRIIHRAENKLIAFKKIISDIYREKNGLKYCLIYAPEGEDKELGEKVIDRYTRAVSELNSSITVAQFTAETKDRNSILEGFADGKIDVLTSMKCLDEGVDVPRSEIAIFCSSTGEPRQYIQRRGRILRKHREKKLAVIYDLVVAPEISDTDELFETERRLFMGELGRVYNFASLADNTFGACEELKPLLDRYKIPLALNDE